MKTLINKTKLRSEQRNQHKADPDKQFYKIIEEIGEVAGAKARGNLDEMQTELGDVLVTLIIYAQQQNIELYDCLNLAYNKILNRNGKLVNGTFIKEEDL